MDIKYRTLRWAEHINWKGEGQGMHTETLSEILLKNNNLENREGDGMIILRL